MMGHKLLRPKVRRHGREEQEQPASLAGLQHEVQQSRLATEAETKTVKKTRKRTEGAAADGMKNGDNSSARLCQAR